jgi:hypothetical protein
VVRRGHRQRHAVVQGHDADILLLEPLDAVTHGGGIGRELLEGIRHHEVPELTVGIQVLHIGIHHVGAFQAVAGLEGALDHAAGLEVAQPDAIEGLALARLHELVFDNRAGVAVQHDLEPASEFIGAVRCHRLFPT